MTEPSAQATAITLIMPCYNRAHDLKRALEAYDRQSTREPFELIAVDDCSKDETYQVLTSYQPRHYLLRVERQEKNAGPASARNRAIPLVRSPLVAFVGDDILPDEDFVQGHLDAHQRYPDRGVAILGKVQWPEDMPCNTLMTHIDGIGAEQFSYHYLVDGQEYDFRHLYTANISLKTEFLRSIDRWFDTDFTHAAFEDVELAYRLSKMGLKIIYQSAIGASHYHYHTLWTFFERQYKSGLMAVVLVRKHFELNHLMRTPLLQVLGLFLRPWLLFREFSEEKKSWAEALAYRLASHYEWDSYAWLDWWYVFLLRYAYFTGVLDGVFGKTRLGAFIRRVYCAHYLIPELRQNIYRLWQEQRLPEFITASEMKILGY